MSNIKYDGGLVAAYSVKDMKKSIKWYTDNLGFKVQYQLDDMGWCELETGTPKVTVGLSQVEKPEVKGGATLTFGVKDIRAARSELEKKGVKFDGDIITIEGMVKLTTFYDLDGNKLMFYQSLQNPQ